VRRRLAATAALVLAGALAASARADTRDAAADRGTRPGGSSESPGGAAPPPPPPPAPARPSWFVLPVLFWMPETRAGLATAAGLHFRLDGAQRASSLFAVGAYTLERQYSADLAAELTLRDGTLLTGRVRAVNFPDLFYGIGPKAPTSAREQYTRRWAQALFSAEFTERTQRFRAGPRLDLRAEDITGLQAGGQLASGRIEGATGFTAVGLGASAAWDTRDLPLFPSRGALVELWYLYYPEELGRHQAFSVVSLEGRVFRRAFWRTIVAAAAYVEQASGNVPFTLLPKLGSTGYLRGWREGRFRDDLATAAQVELRIPLPDRFGAVVFASAGEVARDLGALRADAIRVAGGAGLRFRLTPEGTNIRLDVAESAAGPEVYLVLLEAF
jgi:outer membrane protein assembly factor BamA